MTQPRVSLFFYVFLCLLLGSLNSHAANDIAIRIKESQKALASKDYDSAYNKIIEIAEQGNVDAQLQMADFYTYLIQDAPFSIESFEKFSSFKWNCFTKTQLLGQKHTSKLTYSEEYNQFYYLCKKELAKWLGKAAHQGQEEAQVRLGYLYETGYGVPKNFDRAFYWWKKASQQGHTEGVLMIAKAYLDGTHLEKNYSKAIELFEKSIELGGRHALLDLGKIYEVGIGVDQNIERARLYYLEALERKLPHGALYLAQLYSNSNNKIYDLDQAAKWLFVARRIYPFTRKDFIEVQKLLSTEQREQGRLEAREWIKENYRK